MKWLVRHFLARTFDSEMFSARGQWATVAISICALFIPAGMILTMIPPGPGIDRQLLLFTRVDAIIGLLALLIWPSLLPSRRDYAALAGLPVTSRQIFLARFIASTILGMGAVTTLVVPLSLGSPRLLLQMGGGALATFFGIVAVQGLLLNILPPGGFARASTWVQAALVAVVLGAGAATWSANPWKVPVRAIAASAGWMFVAALAGYALAHARYRALILEAPEQASRPREWRILNLLARDPRRRAILHFLAAVIGRSRLHRMVLAGYGAAGVAILINFLVVARASLLESVALYWPIGLSLVAIAAVRHAFRLPAELGANWLFQITETQGRQQWMSAVERFLIACVIVPIHAAAFPLAVSAFGLPAALRLIVLQLLIALAAFEIVFQTWQQLPFTCSYVPGRTTLMHFLAAWLLILCIIVPVLGYLVDMGAGHWPWFLGMLAASGGLWIRMRKQRRDGWGESPLLYRDTQDLLTLDSAADSPVQLYAQRQRNPETVTQRVSRTLVHAFPEPFRTEEFLQLTEDSLRPGRRQSLRLMLDLALRLPVEHAADLAKDIRYGLRSLAASRGFTLSALLSLGMGICIATCAMSEINGIALREVPEVARPQELVAAQLPVSYPEYERFRAQSKLFSRTAGWIAPVPFDVVLNNRTQRVWGHLVTPSYFATLGIRPALGSFFDASWEKPGRPPAVVLSYRFWHDHLDADPRIAGQTLRINGHNATILGVAQPNFLGASPIFFAADLFVPVTTEHTFAPELNRGGAAGGILNDPSAAILRFTARLRPGATQAQAESALDAVARQFDRDQGVSGPAQRSRRVFLVEGGKVIPMRKQDLPLFGSVLLIIASLVMLIACASVANMKLAHAAARRREIAVRLALGASRGRIIRQLLVESLLLTGAAGLLGFLGSAGLMRALSHQPMPYPMPVTYDFQPDERVLFWTLLMTLATGLFFGLAPALQAARTNLVTALKEGGEVRLGRHRRLTARNLLIVSQVAGSLTLLVALGLLSAGIQTTLGIQEGFNPAHLYLLSLDPVRDGYTPAQAAVFLHKLLDRVQALPSVRAATLTESVPVAMAMYTVPVARPGLHRLLDRSVKHVVGKDYFATIGIPVLAGRTFRRDEETGDSASVVVSAAFASRYFRGEDPVGRRIEIGSDEPVPARTMPGSFDYRVGPAGAPLQSATVVGVVGDVAEGLVVQAPRPVIYLPLRTADYAQPSPAGITLILRAAPGVDALAQVRREIAGMDANVTTFNARSMQDHVEEFMTMLRSASWTYRLIGFFGYVLSVVGLAGVTAYAVQQRRREIGIRMALGATAGKVLALVMKEGALLVAVGTAIGLAGAWAASRGLAAFNATAGKVTSVDPGDPLVIFGSTILLALTALAACYLPARNSARIDPSVTLRQE